MTKQKANRIIGEKVIEVASKFGLEFKRNGYSNDTKSGKFRYVLFEDSENRQVAVNVNNGNVHSCRKLCVSGLHSKFQYAIWDMMKELDIFVENDKGLVLVGGKVYHNSEILTEEDL